MAGYYGFNANFLLTFQAVKNLSAHPTYLHFGLFCKVFDDFWVHLGINNFYKRVSKFGGNARFEAVLKLEFEDKHW